MATRNLFGKVRYIPFKKGDSIFINNIPGSSISDLNTNSLSLPIEEGFKDASIKILIVVDEAYNDDIEIGCLFRGTISKNYYKNLLLYAMRIAHPKDSLAHELNKTRFAAIQFKLLVPTNTVDSEINKNILRGQKLRVESYINELKPDFVIVLGLFAASYILNMEKYFIQQRFGWHFQFVSKTHKTLIVPTLQIPKKFFTLDKYGRSTVKFNSSSEMVNIPNLVGSVAKNIATIFDPSLHRPLKDITPNYIFVNTLKKFNFMMNVLKKHKRIGLDTETTGLGVYDVDLLTIQFAVSKDKCYVVAIAHKDNPFNSADSKYVFDTLRKFFSLEYNIEDWLDGDEDKMYSTPIFIGQNLAFDYRIIRQTFNLPFISRPGWDVMLGEYVLDENLKSLVSVGQSLDEKSNRPKVYSLSSISLRYGTDFYVKEETTFSKDQRVTIKDVHLDEAVLNYCSMDSQVVCGIMEEQLKYSGRLRHINNEFYTKYYFKFMVAQMFATFSVLGTLEQRGAHLSVSKLLELLSENSDIDKTYKKHLEEFNSLDSVSRANDILNKNVPSHTMFGDETNIWQFNLSKPAHKKLLFLNVLKLEPVNIGKTGPAIDKAFQNKYSDTTEIAAMKTLNQIRNLRNSYIKPFYLKLSASHDGSVDHRLRPGYGVTSVLTGRTNSFAPSLQQVPERSSFAKIIKQVFTAEEGKLQVKLDYSAVEVRGWGLISRDKQLAKSFQLGKNLRIMYRKKPSDELKKDILTYGDPHKVNYNFFTGTPIEEVTDELRFISKGITFGCIYGRSVGSIAKEIKKPLDEVKEIVGKFFEKFAEASDWLDWTVKYSANNLYTYSPLGRRRNLPAYILGVPFITSALERRAKNSPIQGMASDFGILASFLFIRESLRFFKSIGEYNGFVEKGIYKVGVNIMVHDSIEAETPYHLLPATLHLLEWATTVGVRDFIKKVYGFEFVVGLEIDFNIGAKGDKMYKWDYSIPSFAKAVKQSLEDQKTDVGYEIDTKAVYSEIVKNWKKHKVLLNKQYPLDHEIIN